MPLIKGFIIYLAVVLTVEIIGVEMSNKDENNSLLYNLISLVGFMFYTYFFYTTARNSFLKKLAITFLILFPILFLISFFLIQGPYIFNTYFYMFGSFMIILFSVLYFLDLFRFPKFVNLMREPSFWFVSGIFFFYTMTLSYFGILNNLLSSIKSNVLEILFTGVYINIVLLYLIFSIGFLCKIRITKSWR